MSNLVKYGICFALVISGVVWLTIEAQSGTGSVYYVKVEEIGALGDNAYSRRLKVAGKVQQGSRRYEGDLLHFTIEGEKGDLLPTHFDYKTGGVLPDNFDDGAMVIVEGTLHRDDRFEAKVIQTKCSSKYEADYDQAKAQYAAQQQPESDGPAR
ncbi:MAG: cytochrome c maturation protein CcmE [Planctomycetota bacterium]